MDDDLGMCVLIENMHWTMIYIWVALVISGVVAYLQK
jgi:hypothetical protein